MASASASTSTAPAPAPALPTRDAPCAQCAAPSKYTCPACSAKTCSAACSSAHKAATACTGARDAAAYVPMNAYGYGALMADYVFLEGVGRAVSGFGADIARRGLGAPAAPTPTATSMRGGARGRGRGGARGGARGAGGGKREALARELAQRDIELRLLPAGMARRAANTSAWDVGSGSALLTLEFRVHPPPDAGADAKEPHALLVHRCKLDAALLPTLQAHVSSARGSKGKGKGKDRAPEWVAGLALPPPAAPDTFLAPAFFMRAPPDAFRALAGGGPEYVPLDGAAPLGEVLKGGSFVEFPTIEVCEAGSAPGGVAEAEEGRPRKRRRVDGAAIGALLGGYGSESDEEMEGGRVEEEVKEGGLGGLEEYGGDEEADGAQIEEEEEEADLGEAEPEEDEEHEPGPIDYAALMDVVRAQQIEDGDDDWPGSDAER